MSVRDMSRQQYLNALKVLRTCPRCHKRLYHFLEILRGVAQTKWKARCVDCGYEWKCRMFARDRDE